MESTFSCKVCGNHTNNIPYKAKELMLGLNHEFSYFECGDCGCLQIDKIPENIADYDKFMNKIVLVGLVGGMTLTSGLVIPKNGIHSTKRWQIKPAYYKYRKKH